MYCILILKYIIKILLFTSVLKDNGSSRWKVLETVLDKVLGEFVQDINSNLVSPGGTFVYCSHLSIQK